MCAVGGYYGVESAWRPFEKQWNKILDDNGLLEHGFHAKEFYGREKGKRVPPYDTWKDEKAEKFEHRLIQAVMRSRIFPFGHGIVVSEWDDLPYDMRRFLSGGHRRKGKFLSSGAPNKSYYLPFQFCVSDAVCNSGANDKVHLFAGIDRTFSDYAGILYRQLYNDPRLQPSTKERMGTLSFPLARETPPLQTADLMVYHLYQFNLRRFRGSAQMPSTLRSLLINRRPRQAFNLLRTPEFYRLVHIAKDASASA